MISIRLVRDSVSLGSEPQFRAEIGAGSRSDPIIRHHPGIAKKGELPDHRSHFMYTEKLTLDDLEDLYRRIGSVLKHVRKVKLGQNEQGIAKRIK